MYAIIATGGKQYKVSEGDVIKVEKLGFVRSLYYLFCWAWISYFKYRK